MASIILAVLASWNIKDARCLSITNDTASDAKLAANMVATEMLSSSGVVLDCVDCASHVTSLCAKDGAKIPAIEALVKKASRVAKVFNKSNKMHYTAAHADADDPLMIPVPAKQDYKGGMVCTTSCFEC